MNTTEYPPRHLPPFRPLVPGDPPWHRTDFTPDMLEDKDGKGPLRPLLLGEKTEAIDELPLNASRTGDWRTLNTSYGPALERDVHFRTRRPLPPPPPTFEHEGKVWHSHVPGDPCPVGATVSVYLYLSSNVVVGPFRAIEQDWSDSGCIQIIGYRIPEAEPQDDAAKLRERIAELEQQLAYLQADYSAAEKATDNVMRILPELNQSPSWEDAANNVRKYIDGLEQQLATALTPRPIEEAGPVKEGFVRFYLESRVHGWMGATFPEGDDTHFIDIALPVEAYPADFEQAFAESGLDAKDKDAVFKLWKGGAR